jgi:hypothetical protein
MSACISHFTNECCLGHEDLDALGHSMHTQSRMTFSSKSVDDFLLNYRHHQSTIQEFISCLDDSPGASRSNCALDSIMISGAKFHDKGSTSFSDADIDSDSSGMESTTKQPSTATRQVIRRALQPKKAIDRKQALSAEEKDERRRFQNREAQRRFRERHMLEAYRKASSNLQAQLVGWLRMKQPTIF